MPLRHFCTSCGAKHEYTLTVPNFCFQCGTPMKAGVVAAKVEQPPTYTVPETSASPPPPKKLSLRERLLAERQAEEDDETETEEDDTPVIIPKNPGFSIEIPKANKESIGSLAVGPTKAGPRIREKRDGILVTKNKKEFLKQFRKMAGTQAQGRDIV